MGANRSGAQSRSAGSSIHQWIVASIAYRSTVDDECCSTIVGFSRRHVVDNWPPEKLQSFPGTCFSSVGNIVPGGRDVGWRLCARLFRRECSRDPGQQVRHYSLVCRRMCLDGAGLAGRLSSAREKGVGTAALVCRRLPPCPWTPFQAFPLLRCLRSGTCWLRTENRL